MPKRSLEDIFGAKDIVRWLNSVLLVSATIVTIIGGIVGVILFYFEVNDDTSAELLPTPTSHEEFQSGSSFSSPSATPDLSSQSRNPTQIPTTQPTQSPSNTPLPSATPVPCPGLQPPRLSIGDTAFVIGGLGVNALNSHPLRPSEHPGASERIGSIEPGEQVRILDGPECGYEDGIVWWYVDFDGLRGWTGESDLDNYWLQESR